GNTGEARGRGTAPEVCSVALPGSKTGAMCGEGCRETWEVPFSRSRDGTADQAKVSDVGRREGSANQPQRARRGGGSLRLFETEAPPKSASGGSPSQARPERNPQVPRHSLGDWCRTLLVTCRRLHPRPRPCRCRCRCRCPCPHLRLGTDQDIPD